jgi:hypothetical protein
MAGGARVVDADLVKLECHAMLAVLRVGVKPGQAGTRRV